MAWDARCWECSYGRVRSFCEALWFNQPFMADRFRVGERVLVSGKPKYFGNRWQMTHPAVKNLEEADLPSGGLLPIYPLTEGLRQGHMRKLVRAALMVATGRIDDVLPPAYAATAGPGRHRLGDRAHSLSAEHERGGACPAAVRLSEPLVMQLALALRRAEAVELRVAIRCRFRPKSTPGFAGCFPSS